MTNPERRDIVEKMSKIADQHARETRHECVVNDGAESGVFVSCKQCGYTVNETQLAEIGAKGG